MASAPTYDPNLIEKPSGYAKIQATQAPCSPAAPLLNRATQGLYPPGSTFKTVTAAAALDDGVFTPSSIFHDPGYCTEYGKQVSNALDQSGGAESFGNISLFDAYVHSVNAVYCMIGQKLGAGRVLDEAKKFGFYSVPPLETPADSRSPSGLYNGTQPLQPEAPGHAGRSGAARVRPGAHARHAAADGSRRSDDRKRRRHSEADADQAGGDAGRQHRHAPASARLEARGQADDGRGDPRHDGAGRPARHRHRRADLRRHRRGQDRHRRAGRGQQRATTPGSSSSRRPRTRSSRAQCVVENQPNGFGGAIAAPIAKAIMQAILPAASNGKP